MWLYQMGLQKQWLFSNRSCCAQLVRQRESHTLGTARSTCWHVQLNSAKSHLFKAFCFQNVSQCV